ncbi:MAG: toll/interleukin-1 receptor domain-containing protein [Deltaproteobacteria bacterium]|nr:toll/interleukin-1 receptor domain-containing protein [Deltaproteobacteria bacterium]
MATLWEYYQKDSGRTLCIKRDVVLRDQSGKSLLNVPTALHVDFESNSLYISFYIPHQSDIECPSRLLLNSVSDVLSRKNNIFVQGGSQGEEGTSITEMVFTGRIFIYSEDDVTVKNKTYINQRSKELGQSVKFRGQSYAEGRNKFERPLGFISHDSRDKMEIAGPLAIQLQKLMCPVWYDQYSLMVGHSLREQIEKGLKECKKCILILTPNYLSNEGWGKKEFDSVFTSVSLLNSGKAFQRAW